MRQLTVEPEFENKIPPLSADEFSRLETNILEDGEVREPIVMWGNTIIDGHNRWKIIQKHPDLKWTVKQMDFPDKWAAIAWMCRNQLGRRNLTDEQKSYLRGKQYEAEKMSVPNETGLNQYSEVAGQNVRQPEARREQRDGTAGRIGKENGVDGRTIRRDADFANGLDAADEVFPGIKEAVLSGDVKAPKTMIAEIRNLSDDKKKEASEAIMNKDIPAANAVIKPDDPKPQEEPRRNFTPDDLRDLLDAAMETLKFTLEQHLVLMHMDILKTKAGNDVALHALKIGHSILEKYQDHVRSVKISE